MGLYVTVCREKKNLLGNKTQDGNNRLIQGPHKESLWKDKNPTGGACPHTSAVGFVALCVTAWCVLTHRADVSGPCQCWRGMSWMCHSAH